MSSRYFLDHQKISLLYKYYLLGDLSWLGQTENQAQTEKQKAKIVWFLTCLEKEKCLIKKIKSKLREGWDFSHFPPLEKAVLFYASHEIFFNKDIFVPSLIDQTIDFSKKYLEPDKYKYINKVLDLLFKSGKLDN